MVLSIVPKVFIVHRLKKFIFDSFYVFLRNYRHFIERYNEFCFANCKTFPSHLFCISSCMFLAYPYMCHLLDVCYIVTWENNNIVDSGIGNLDKTKTLNWSILQQLYAIFCVYWQWLLLSSQGNHARPTIYS